jgi:tetratricopeptide (TPR) repeat protein
MRIALAQTLVLQDRYDEALQQLEKARTLDPEDPEPLVVESTLLTLQGEFDRAEAVCREILDREDLLPNPGIAPLAHLYMTQGRFRELHELLEDSNMPLLQGTAHFATRQWDEALAYFKKGRNQYSQGLVYLEMGSLESAQEAATGIEKLHNTLMLKKSYTFNQKYLLNLQGRIALEQGDYTQALDLLSKALALCPQEHVISELPLERALFLDPIAEAQYRSGDLRSAIDTYADITRLTLGRLEYGYIFARAFYHLGRLFEELGDRSRALENYGRFLEVWEQADPGREEVKVAQDRVAALSRSGI